MESWRRLVVWLCGRNSIMQAVHMHKLNDWMRHLAGVCVCFRQTSSTQHKQTCTHNTLVLSVHRICKIHKTIVSRCQILSKGCTCVPNGANKFENVLHIRKCTLLLLCHTLHMYGYDLSIQHVSFYFFSLLCFWLVVTSGMKEQVNTNSKNNTYRIFN